MPQEINMKLHNNEKKKVRREMIDENKEKNYIHLHCTNYHPQRWISWNHLIWIAWQTEIETNKNEDAEFINEQK